MLIIKKELNLIDILVC